jgi:hypothetical protein
LDALFAKVAEPSSSSAALTAAEPSQQQTGSPATPKGPSAASAPASTPEGPPSSAKEHSKQLPPASKHITEQAVKPAQSSTQSSTVTVAKIDNPPCEVLLHSGQDANASVHTLSIKSLGDTNKKLPKGTKFKAYTAGKFVRCA